VNDELLAKLALGVGSPLPEDEEEEEPDARAIDDVDAVRRDIFANVEKAVAGRFPLENDRYRLQVADLGWDDGRTYTLADQKRAIMRRQSLGRRLRGTWELVDKGTGQVADRKRSTIVQVPYMTQRGTFIDGGREYAVANQFRLRPGVYARRRGDGGVEAHFNLPPGAGRSFRVRLDPASGEFHADVGQASLPLYPVLRALGVSDEELKEGWGEELFSANQRRSRDSEKAVSHAYLKLVGGKEPAERHAAALAEHVNRLRLDPEVVRASLGKYLGEEGAGKGELAMSPRVLVAATRKLVGVNRGEDEPDDRDSLANQTLMGPEDFFAERIARDAGGVARNILWASTFKGRLAKVPAGALNAHMEAVLRSSGVAESLEEINPLETLDQRARVTRMGSGGIGSIDSIPAEARGVQPSYLGYVDPFRSTECYSADTEVRAHDRWLPWPEATAGHSLGTLIGPEPACESPLQVVSYDFDGVLYGYDDGLVSYLVTPDHRMWTAPSPEGPWRYDLARDLHRTPGQFVRMLGGGVHPLSVDRYRTEPHKGKVYCATMPSGILAVRRGGGRGFYCGNSEKVGVDNRLALGVRKGRDGQLYRRLTDASGRPRWVSAREAARSAVAFPGELESGAPAVRAVVDGRVDTLPRDQVKYGVAHPDDMHDSGVNLIPFANATQGNRLMVAGKMMLQAMSLRNREAPRVMTRVRGADETHEARAGAGVGAVRAEAGGTVESVSPGALVVRTDDGQRREIELYDNFPLNRKSYFYNRPLVAPGQRVERGQVLAASNYTDDAGNLALGTHLRTAFLPYKGLAHEDAYVISESAAKKMTHEAMYTADFDKTDGVEAGFDRYVSLFPSTFGKAQLSRMGGDGVIRPGSVVRKGDPLVLAVGAPLPPPAGQLAREVHRSSGRHRDVSVLWEHDYDGEVTDAEVGEDGGVRVAVRAAVPLKPGDKISGLHGDKGVVGAVVPDHRMPHDGDGKPYDLIQNPLTLPTRKNPAQVYAMLLAKAAAKRGKPYLMDKYHPGSLREFVSRELRKHGLNGDGTEDLYDPETGRALKGILTGDKYVLKLHHTAEAKAGARDIGAYDSEGNPRRGGGDGAKSMTGLGLNALLAHNASAVLRDMKEHKAGRNDDFWRSFRLGRPTPSPKPSLVYRKMLAHLAGAGVRLDRTGDYTHLMAMTDKDVLELSGDRVVKSPDTLDDRTMKPIPGGLFDRGMFGGVGGEGWGRIELPEPMPSPVMEDAVKLALGLTGKEFEELLSGRKKVNGLTGGRAVGAALDRLKLDDEINLARETIRSGSRTARDRAVRRLGLYTTAKRQGIHPRDWMLTKVPVLPPIFRPIAKMSNNVNLVSDPNQLYQDLLHNVGALKDASAALGDEGSAEERLNAYKALKAVAGLGDPVHPKLREKGVEGLLGHVFGKGAPKFGMYQRKLLGSSVDMSGRGVIVGNPGLDIDEIGVPEEQAWTMFRPFVIRNLVRSGMPATRAVDEVERRTDTARSRLLNVLSSRPLLATRAPALNYLHIMAFKPRLVAGKAIQTSPLVISSFTGDYDGNCCDFDTALSLSLSTSKLHSTKAGRVWLRALEEVLMRTTGESLVWVDGAASTQLRIGEFPRVGEPIKDRNGADIYAVPDGVSVLTYDHVNGRVCRERVTKLTVERDCACSKVICGGNHEVIVSDNESLYAFDADLGAMRRMTPAEALGRRVPAVRREPVVGTEFDYELGWWYGALVSDGWVNGRTVGYAKTEEAKRQAFERIAREKLTVNFTCYEYREKRGEHKLGDSVKLHLNSSDLVGRVFNCVSGEYDGVGRRALFKKVPDEILNRGSRQCLLGFLAGMLDGDGSLAVNRVLAKPRIQVTISTSSPYLVSGLRAVLRRLGVRATVQTVPPRGHSNTAYTLCPSVVDLFALLPELEMVGERERTMIEKFKTFPLPYDARDMVPVPKKLARLARRSMSCGTAASRAERTAYAVWYKAGNTGEISRPWLRAFMRRAPDFNPEGWDDFLDFALADDVYWVKVERVENAGRREVFDLEVPSTKVFAVNDGLIIYDTMSMHIPVSKEAVEEAYEKMLPSKHLRNAATFDVHYLPSQEFQLGLYQATQKAGKKSRRHRFASLDEVRRAYRRGEIALTDEVVVGA
jgi:DNA-directed RNA polymerase beta subunit/DNA-directed RNA polymerase beta' subunit